jgi:hypothetical protein
MLAVIAGFLAVLWILLMGIHALLDHILPDGVIAVVYVILFTWGGARDQAAQLVDTAAPARLDYAPAGGRHVPPARRRSLAGRRSL